MERKFVVHDSRDNVGVAIKPISAGEEVQGMYLDTREEITCEAKQPIRFGHKIALREIAVNEHVFRYGESIGVATKAISRGEHVHVHNVRSDRC